MNIKLHTPKSLKMGSGMNSLKQFLLSFVAILFTTCGMCVAQHIPQVPDYSTRSTGWCMLIKSIWCVLTNQEPSGSFFLCTVLLICALWRK